MLKVEIDVTAQDMVNIIDNLDDAGKVSVFKLMYREWPTHTAQLAALNKLGESEPTGLSHHYDNEEIDEVDDGVVETTAPDFESMSSRDVALLIKRKDQDARDYVNSMFAEIKSLMGWRYDTICKLALLNGLQQDSKYKKYPIMQGLASMEVTLGLVVGLREMLDG